MWEWRIKRGGRKKKWEIKQRFLHRKCKEKSVKVFTKKNREVLKGNKAKKEMKERGIYQSFLNIAKALSLNFCFSKFCQNVAQNIFSFTHRHVYSIVQCSFFKIIKVHLSSLISRQFRTRVSTCQFPAGFSM